MHEYEQLEDGPIRDKTMQAITAAAIQQHLNKDLNLTEAAIREDFTAFFSVLHHHLHQLAARSVPLGLHAFGLNPEADTLTLTVLQQLGKPWFDSLKLDHAETMARDNEKSSNHPPINYCTNICLSLKQNNLTGRPCHRQNRNNISPSWRRPHAMPPICRQAMKPPP